MHYYYLDFVCCDGHEISTGFVMSKLANFLHLQFVNLSKQHSQNPVGIAFPAYRGTATTTMGDEGSGPPTIGNYIRLWAVENSLLEELAKQVSRIGLEDYVVIGSVKRLESEPNQYCCFERKQFKPLNVERLIRRRMKRHGESEAQARSHYRNYNPATSELPFLNMKSLSSGTRFRLFIQKRVQATAQPGVNWSFNSYGLGNAVLIPDLSPVLTSC